MKKEKNKYECEFADICPDVQELQYLGIYSKRYEDLIDQYGELCSTGGYGCSRKKDFLKEKQKQQLLEGMISYELTGGILMD